MWKCRCSCGKEVSVRGSSLRSGITISCGHIRVERLKEALIKSKTTHGLSKTKEYKNLTTRNRTEKKIILDSSWEIHHEIALFDLFNSCILCGSDRDLSVDHLLPLDLGYGLFTDNAVILCKSCNSIKSKKYITDLPAEMRRKLIDASCEFQDYMERVV